MPTMSNLLSRRLELDPTAPLCRIPRLGTLKSRPGPGTFTTMDEAPVPDLPISSPVEPASQLRGRPGPESLEITIDAVDVEAAARFWSEALGYDRLYERPPYVVLGPPSGAGPACAHPGGRHAGSGQEQCPPRPSRARPRRPRSGASRCWARLSTGPWQKRAPRGRSWSTRKAYLFASVLPEAPQPERSGAPGKRFASDGRSRGTGQSGPARSCAPVRLLRRPTRS